MTRTRQIATRAVALVSLILATGLVATPLAQAAPSTPLAGQSRPGKGHAASATRTPATATAPAPSTAPDDFASIYSGEYANLTNSGWATCSTPIAWTVDARGLTGAQGAAQIDNLQWAFAAWAQASGLTFEYAGELDVTYDDAAFTMVPADGSGMARRHIYLDFASSTDSARLTGNVVGLASPSQVLPSSREIIGGEAVFRIDHVTSATSRAVKSLYLHELGHILGLAHALAESNVMYPIVTTHIDLGAGDINGVKSFAKPCLV